jgi:hypothetical protein
VDGQKAELQTSPVWSQNHVVEHEQFGLNSLKPLDEDLTECVSVRLVKHGVKEV